MRHHEIWRQTTKRGALPEGDRRPRRRRGGAAGDLLGTSRHAGEQERGSSAPPGGLQDPAPQDEALQYRRRGVPGVVRSEEHTSELQSLRHLVCRLLLEKKKET